MKLPEAISENIDPVMDSLNLIETDSTQPDLVRLILDSLTQEERVELTKGMFLSVRLLFRAMDQEPDPVAITQLLSSMVPQADNEHHLNGALMRLLHSMDNDGGSFYLQLYGLKNPVEITRKLIYVFKDFSFRFYGNDLNADTLTVVGKLKTYVSQIGAETAQRNKERAALTDLMRKENESCEAALRVMEILSPYFSMDVTDSGQKVFFLKEESLYEEEVVKAVRVPEQAELLKGVCIVSCVFLSMYLTVGSVIPVLDERRAQLIAEAYIEGDDEDDDVYTQFLALNLLDSIAKMDEDDFNEQVAGIDDLYGIILSLNTSLHRTIHNGLGRKTKDILPSLRQLLNKGK